MMYNFLIAIVIALVTLGIFLVIYKIFDAQQTKKWLKSEPLLVKENLSNHYFSQIPVGSIFYYIAKDKHTPGVYYRFRMIKTDKEECLNWMWIKYPIKQPKSHFKMKGGGSKVSQFDSTELITKYGILL